MHERLGPSQLVELNNGLQGATCGSRAAVPLRIRDASARGLDAGLVRTAIVGALARGRDASAAAVRGLGAPHGAWAAVDDVIGAGEADCRPSRASSRAAVRVHWSGDVAGHGQAVPAAALRRIFGELLSVGADRDRIRAGNIAIARGDRLAVTAAFTGGRHHLKARTASDRRASDIANRRAVLRDAIAGGVGADGATDGGRDGHTSGVGWWRSVGRGNVRAIG